MITGALIAVAAALAGAASAWFFLFVLSVHVRRTVAAGYNPPSGAGLTALRVLVPAAVVAASFALGASAGAAALAGFIAGRAALTGRFASQLGCACSVKPAAENGGAPRMDC